MDTYAIFIDAGYFRGQHMANNPPKAPLMKANYPTVSDVEKLVQKYETLPYFKNSTLYRVFYYDSLPPKAGTLEANETFYDPFSKSNKPKFDPSFIKNSYRMWNELMKLPYFAMRRGNLVSSAWEVSEKNFQSVMKKLEGGQPLSVGDLVKSKKQKQVDMKIGMDISHVALKRLVSKVILVAGDADLAPAAKQARVEGIQVYLDPLGHKSIREDLHNHIDVCLV